MKILIRLLSVKLRVSHFKYKSTETRHVKICDEAGESQWAFDATAVNHVVTLHEGAFFKFEFTSARFDVCRRATERRWRLMEMKITGLNFRFVSRKHMDSNDLDYSKRIKCCVLWIDVVFWCILWSPVAE